MMETRRNVLAVMAALIPLTACGALVSVIDPKLGPLVTAVEDLSGGLGALPSWLSGLVPADTLSSVVALVGQLGALAAQIGGVTSLSGAVPLIGGVETAVNSILALLGAAPLPAIVTELLNAAATYLPTIIMLAGLVAAPRPRGARRFAAMMPLEGARAILRRAANSR